MTRTSAIVYHDYLPYEEVDLVRRIQAICANIAERAEYTDDVTLLPNDRQGPSALWGDDDVEAIAAVFRESPDPRGLFRYMDEKTGSSDVGYRTRDGREWFHILRQIRNASATFFDLIWVDDDLLQSTDQRKIARD
jgi:hypothetical protein